MLAPTLVASRTALPPGGAAAPAGWQSQTRGTCLEYAIGDVVRNAWGVPSA
jgi:hypothetical protein